MHKKKILHIITSLGDGGAEGVLYRLIKNSLKDWDLDYTERKSLTSDDSFLLNIKRIKKIKIDKKN